jgi:hypothetical protein
MLNLLNVLPIFLFFSIVTTTVGDNEYVSEDDEYYYRYQSVLDLKITPDYISFKIDEFMEEFSAIGSDLLPLDFANQHPLIESGSVSITDKKIDIYITPADKDIRKIALTNSLHLSIDRVNGTYRYFKQLDYAQTSLDKNWSLGDDVEESTIITFREIKYKGEGKCGIAKKAMF